MNPWELPWTPEPWAPLSYGQPPYHSVMAGDLVIINQFADSNFDRMNGERIQTPDVNTQNANMKRLVSCVNGCAGLNPEALPGMVNVLEEAMGEGLSPLEIAEILKRIKLES